MNKFIDQEWIDGYRDGLKGIFTVSRHAGSNNYQQGWISGDRIFSAAHKVNAA